MLLTTGKAGSSEKEAVETVEIDVDGAFAAEGRSCHCLSWHPQEGVGYICIES